ncbi:DoxX family protein [Sphingobium sufflavum]|uniref:DoxX family protein n=1 Tax=Sphingobium sufflavum TaxID=1129547 RepID=UPI001F34425C|nr:DoxX family protein [Sphingobium sufflavum]
MTQAPDNPRWMTLTGRAITTLVVLFLLMDAAMKLPPLAVVGETMAAMGWPADAGTARLLGVILLVATLLHLWPRTALLGAILLTGYLGGAIATHVRIASPLFSHILFGVYVGLLLWGGFWLRNPALRALLPCKA